MNAIPEKLIKIDQIPPTPSSVDIKQIEDVASRTKDLDVRIKELEGEAKNMRFVLDVGKYVVVGIIIILFVAFLGFGYDYWRFHGDMYKQNIQSIESLKNELINERNKNMQIQVDQIMKNIEQPHIIRYPRTNQK